MDFSNLDGMDDIDWSDVEGELQKNREMLIQEAKGDQAESAAPAGGAPDVAPVQKALPTELNIDFLREIPLKLTVVIGRTKLLVKELLEIDVNSIVELKKKVGEPLDVLINDKYVAKGEIIVQNEKFGLKIVEIIDEKDRINSLR